MYLWAGAPPNVASTLSLEMWSLILLISFKWSSWRSLWSIPWRNCSSWWRLLLIFIRIIVTSTTINLGMRMALILEDFRVNLCKTLNNSVLITMQLVLEDFTFFFNSSLVISLMHLHLFNNIFDQLDEIMGFFNVVSILLFDCFNESFHSFIFTTHDESCFIIFTSWKYDHSIFWQLLDVFPDLIAFLVQFSFVLIDVNSLLGLYFLVRTINYGNYEIEHDNKH